MNNSSWVLEFYAKIQKTQSLTKMSETTDELIIFKDAQKGELECILIPQRLNFCRFWTVKTTLSK